MEGVWQGRGEQRERGLNPRAQTLCNPPRSLRYNERRTKSLATGSGLWERPWSAGPVEAK